MLYQVPIHQPFEPVGDGSDAIATTIDDYMQILQALERMHRLMLDLIKDEFERLGRHDLTPIQGLILYNLGQEEVSAGELRSRGIYQGSNVSYNLKKLVAMGYIHHQRCELDRRSVRVRLTDIGVQARDIIDALFKRHARSLIMAGVLKDPPLAKVNRQFKQIERYWNDQIRYIY